MGERAKKARELFEQGYNCAQSVAGAFADEMGLPFETVVRLSSTFGGGMGRLREVCGAVSGMMLVAGMKYGYTGPKDFASKKRTYAMVQALAEEFRAANGSIVCRELLGLSGKSNPSPAPRTGEYYKKRPCAELVEYAAHILEKYEPDENKEK